MSDEMTPTKWEAEYAKGTPHWAKDMTPSAFAKDFVVKLRRRKLNNILEIGGGNGRDSIYFVKEGFTVTTIDVSPSAVKLIQDNVDNAGVTIQVRQANANYLPFPSGIFGAVFSLSVLHSTMLDKSIPEVYRVLRHGGYAFIYIYGNTEFRGGEPREIISVDSYLKLLKYSGFIIWDFYTEEEEKFDSYGEKHKLLVAFLGKG